jgi:hypothetical protein
MSDYISREAAIDRLNKNLSACNPGTFSEMCYADAIETVKHLPSADVEPVRHGRWEYNAQTIHTQSLMRCSFCGWWTLDPSVDGAYHYCPNCGAKMDLEQEHG